MVVRSDAVTSSQKMGPVIEMAWLDDLAKLNCGNTKRKSKSIQYSFHVNKKLSWKLVLSEEKYTR